MPKKKPNKSSNNEIVCAACKFTFKSLIQYADHLDRRKACMDASHKCNVCNTIFATLASMEQHQRSNSYCRNVADEVSKIGHEFETIEGLKKKKG